MNFRQWFEAVREEDWLRGMSLFGFPPGTQVSPEELKKRYWDLARTYHNSNDHLIKVGINAFAELMRGNGFRVPGIPKPQQQSSVLPKSRRDFGEYLHKNFIIPASTLAIQAANATSLKQVDDMTIRARDEYIQWVKENPQENHPFTLAAFDDMLESTEMREGEKTFRPALRRFHKALNSFYDKYFFPGFMKQ